MYSLLTYNEIESSPFHRSTDTTYHSEMDSLDANAIWECWDNFSLIELEASVTNGTDDEIVRKNKSEYFKSFKETIENKIPRYSDHLLDKATSYVYMDLFSEQGLVIVQFNVKKLIIELQTLMQSNDELQYHFNPRYGGCSLHVLNMVKGDLTFSLFDSLKNTDCIQKYIILETIDSVD